MLDLTIFSPCFADFLDANYNFIFPPVIFSSGDEIWVLGPNHVVCIFLETIHFGHKFRFDLLRFRKRELHHFQVFRS